MSKTSPVYHFTMLQEGDIFYGPLDQRNMVTIENQFADLYAFIGPGVVSGWDVTKLWLSSMDPLYTSLGPTLAAERQALCQAALSAPDSYLGGAFVMLFPGAYAPVSCATTVPITLSSPPSAIDGVTLTVNMRVLVKNQTTTSQNGIYVYSGGILTRSTDMNTSALCLPSQCVMVTHGAVNQWLVYELIPSTNGSYVLGTDPLTWYNAWQQCVRVTPGNGIVGLFPAQIITPVYFRFTRSDVFYIWAEASACLRTEGYVAITAPQTPDINYDSRRTATYLATVNVAETTTTSNIYYIDTIVYEDKRQQLKDLEGALLAALRLSFYHHQHLGGPDHPSKINLSTQIVLQATGPGGSTIFQVQDPNGLLKGHTLADFGVPIVRLNNTALPQSAYRYDFNSGLIYLRNSISSGSTLQLVLPLSPQIALHLKSGTTLAGGTDMYLSDGVHTYDTNGNDLGERTFTWDAGYYLPADVYLRGAILPTNVYTVTPNKGTINILNSALTPSPSPVPAYNATDVSVIITHIGRQIQGKLSRSRIGSINGAAFTKGVFDPTRIQGLDHYGQFRYREQAFLEPHLRLFAAGDHQTYYPEITTGDLQYSTEIYTLFNSVNFTGEPLLIGTKRGLMQTATAEYASLIASWDPDQGEVAQIIDDILQAEPGDNHFKTTYARTVEGGLYKTVNGGASWVALNMPTYTDVLGITRIAKCTAFCVSTERIEVTVNSIVKYQWSSLLYLGTDQGLFTAQVQEGQSDADWQWAQDSSWYSSPSYIHAVAEIVTLHRVVTESDTIESYDRTVYVGADSGFYLGTTQTAGNLISTDVVKGFHWIRSGGAAQNDLLWWTDHKVMLSHTAQFVEISTSTSDTTYWVHPLTTVLPYVQTSALATASVVATAAVTLSGGGTVDGVALTNGMRVLVTNQANPITNGVYVVNTSGAWARSSDLLAAVAIAKQWVVITAGTYAGSAWGIGSTAASPVVGTAAQTWTCLYHLVEATGGYYYRNVDERPSTTQYFLLTSAGPRLVTDGFDSINHVWKQPVVGSLTWDAARQGESRTIKVLSSTTTVNGRWVIGTPRGLFQSQDLGVSWQRTHREFTYQALLAPSLFVEQTLVPLTAPMEYGTWVAASSLPMTLSGQYTNANDNFQSFEFYEAQPNWLNLVYERDYTTYWVTPWIDTGADVIVYIDDKPSDIATILNPALGQIVFTQPLDKTHSVFFTLSRPGAFISNTGTVPHEEMPNVFVVGSTKLTTLAADLSPTSLTISVADPLAIPVDATYLELRTTTSRERIQVTVDPTSRQINITLRRATTAVLPKQFTDVYEVNLETVLGIDDLISKATTNETYNFNSVAGANLLQMSIRANDVYTNLFSNFSGLPDPAFAAEADRGPKKALFFDFSGSQVDTRASSSSLYEGIEPTLTSTPQMPHTAYVLSAGVPYNGDQMRVGADQGIWRLDAGSPSEWRKEDPLGGATRVYFLQTITFYNASGYAQSQLAAGTDKGLYLQLPGTTTWQFNPTYPQAVFDYLTFSWFSGNGEAYGKNDGLAFIYTPNGQTAFTSDHYNDVDGKNVYGLWKAQFIRITTDANGNSQQTPVDALYLCVEDGLYAVTDGSRNQPFASLLAGRLVFSPDDANGNRVKIYKIFQSPRTATFLPMIILTSNGVYVVRNWRWSDPTDATTSNFLAESHSLDGLTCNCHCAIIETPDSMNPTRKIYKIFVGTNQGVWRSYNEGYSFERCERLGGNNVTVYDLQAVGVCVLAATDDGLWFSPDDGDTWYRTNDTSSGETCLDFQGAVSLEYSFGGAYLSQVFSVPTAGRVFNSGTGLYEATVQKISLYLSCLPAPLSSDPAYSTWLASQDNTLDVAIYQTDGSNVPLTSATLTPVSSLNSLLWAAGYQATSSWLNARRIYDKNPEDDTTYIENTASSGDASLTAQYDLHTSHAVGALEFRVFYTQGFAYLFEYSDDNATWTSALTSTYTLPDQNGGGVWITLHHDSTQIISSAHRYWRLSVKDVHTSASVSRDVRLGDYRLYNGSGNQYALNEVLLAADVQYPGFYSVYLTVTLPDATKEYALVGHETIASGGMSVFNWIKSAT